MESPSRRPPSPNPDQTNSLDAIQLILYQLLSKHSFVVDCHTFPCSVEYGERSILQSGNPTVECLGWDSHVPISRLCDCGVDCRQSAICISNGKISTEKIWESANGRLCRWLLSIGPIFHHSKTKLCCRTVHLDYILHIFSCCHGRGRVVELESIGLCSIMYLVPGVGRTDRKTNPFKISKVCRVSETGSYLCA